MRVLTSFRVADMDSAIKTLDQQKIDILMKYIYRGFEAPSEKTCSLLLAWHEKVSLSLYVSQVVKRHWHNCCTYTNLKQKTHENKEKHTVYNCTDLQKNRLTRNNRIIKCTKLESVIQVGRL